jgi:hypothetical protein
MTGNVSCHHKGGSMRSLVTALSVMLITSFVFAQHSSPAPAVIPAHDTMQLGKNAPDGEDGAIAMCQRGGKRLFPGHGMNFERNNMASGYDETQCPGFGRTYQGMRGPRAMRCCPPLPHFLALPFCCGILFLGILLWGIINILLTVIISIDMTKNGSFNGLWIPILLIAGIPGSIIYALFRLGDKISCKGT